MQYLTIKKIKELIKPLDDEAIVCIKAKTQTGDSLYLDIEAGILKDTLKGQDGLLFTSSGLDLTIEAEMEQIKLEYGGGDEIW